MADVLVAVAAVREAGEVALGLAAVAREVDTAEAVRGAEADTAAVAELQRAHRRCHDRPYQLT